MTFSRFVLAALLAALSTACSSTHAVQETAADRAYFDRLGEILPQDPFWIPAEPRFTGTLLSDALIPAQSSATIADRYMLPVFPVVREALTRAVEASFALPYRSDRAPIALHLNARSDALEIEFHLPKVLTDHEGAAGEMRVSLSAVAVVRYPAPDRRELARVPIEVNVTSMMDDSGAGVNGAPGPLWLAAAELARRFAAALQGNEVRRHFAYREAFIERVHSTTGEPAPKDLPGIRFDSEGKHGEYVEVVRLIRR